MGSEIMEQKENRPSLKECLFSSAENPGINFFRDKMVWVMANFPDLSVLDGWKVIALRVFGIAYFFTLLGWLISEGFSIIGILIRMFLMSLFFGIVYAHIIAGFCFVVLHKWEMFK